ncbi:MAG TPA: Rpn family recombination-promoting nuclease/putative transposase [Chitinophagaceae bacterium]|nr:Rpn family recombination-promoting nuclease/putative transposase [Chitinophagaceae bacterium]
MRQQQIKERIPTKEDIISSIGTYVDPMSDFGFKHLFGQEPHKDLLIDFLNQLLAKKGKHIVDLTYNRNETVEPNKDARKTIYDLTCTGKDGEKFIIEVQRVNQPFFKDRAVYYTSAVIRKQGLRGKKWNYGLKEVYFIGLMDFSFKDSAPDQYLRRVQLYGENEKQPFYDKLSFTFIEIPKFTKKEEELETGLDRWLYVLKNMSRLKKIPVILNKTILQKLFTIAAVANLSKEEYMRYQKNLMDYWDAYASLQAEREKGRQEGREELIRNFLKTGDFTIRQLAISAGVSEAFVRKVKKTLE